MQKRHYVLKAGIILHTIFQKAKFSVVHEKKLWFLKTKLERGHIFYFCIETKVVSSCFKRN